MVTKKEGTKKGGRVKVKNLEVNKETEKDLTDAEAKKIRGGAGGSGARSCSEFSCPAKACGIVL